jgi:hypothetical protein
MVFLADVYREFKTRCIINNLNIFIASLIAASPEMACICIVWERIAESEPGHFAPSGAAKF